MKSNLFSGLVPIADQDGGGGGSNFRGGYNATTNTPALDDRATPISGIAIGDFWIVSVAGTFFGTPVGVGDEVAATVVDPIDATGWSIIPFNGVTFDAGQGAPSVGNLAAWASAGQSLRNTPVNVDIAGAMTGITGLQTTAFQLTTGASADLILKSDATGNASWQAGGTGDVIGPGANTANRVALFTGASNTIKESSVMVVTLESGLSLTDEINGISRIQIRNLTNTTTNYNIGTTGIIGVAQPMTFAAGIGQLTTVGDNVGGSKLLLRGSSFQIDIPSATANFVLQSSDVDGNATWINPATLGFGDVSSSESSVTGNAVPRWDATTGKLIKTSSVTISDTGLITSTGLSAGTVTATTSASTPTLTLGGTSNIVLGKDGTGFSYVLNFPDATPAFNQVLQISATDATILEWAEALDGDVKGPASAADNALARFDTGTGKLIQSSTAILTDAGTLTLSSVSSNSFILRDVTQAITLLAPTLAASYSLALPADAGISGQHLATNGLNTLSWQTPPSGPTVAGAGTIWFSDASGLPIGNTANLNWNNTTNTLSLINLTATTAIQGATVIGTTSISSPSLVLTGAFNVTLTPNAIPTAAISLAFPPAPGAVGQALRTTVSDASVLEFFTPTTGTVIGPGTATSRGIANYANTSGNLLLDSTVKVTAGGTGLEDVAGVAGPLGGGNISVSAITGDIILSTGQRVDIQAGLRIQGTVTDGLVLTSSGGDGTAIWSTAGVGNVIASATTIATRLPVWTGDKTIGQSTIALTGINSDTLTEVLGISGLVAGTSPLTLTSFLAGDIVLDPTGTGAVDIRTKLVYNVGTALAGKILTSNAIGEATWETGNQGDVTKAGAAAVINQVATWLDDGNKTIQPVPVTISSTTGDIITLGQITMDDTNKGAGKVLVSDLDGKGTWTTLTNVARVGATTNNAMTVWDGINADTIKASTATLTGTNMAGLTDVASTKLTLVGTTFNIDLTANPSAAQSLILPPTLVDTGFLQTNSTGTLTWTPITFAEGDVKQAVPAPTNNQVAVWSDAAGKFIDGTNMTAISGTNAVTLLDNLGLVSLYTDVLTPVKVIELQPDAATPTLDFASAGIVHAAGILSLTTAITGSTLTLGLAGDAILTGEGKSQVIASTDNLELITQDATSQRTIRALGNATFGAIFSVADNTGADTIVLTGATGDAQVTSLSLLNSTFTMTHIAPTLIADQTLTWPATIVAGNFLQVALNGDLTWAPAAGGGGGDVTKSGSSTANKMARWVDTGLDINATAATFTKGTNEVDEIQFVNSIRFYFDDVTPTEVGQIIANAPNAMSFGSQVPGVNVNVLASGTGDVVVSAENIVLSATAGVSDGLVVFDGLGLVSVDQAPFIFRMAEGAETPIEARITGPDNQAGGSDYTVKMPHIAPTAATNQILQTDGNGNMAWIVTPAGGGDITQNNTPAATNFGITYWNTALGKQISSANIQIGPGVSADNLINVNDIRFNSAIDGTLLGNIGFGGGNTLELLSNQNFIVAANGNTLTLSATGGQLTMSGGVIQASSFTSNSTYSTTSGDLTLRTTVGDWLGTATSGNVTLSQTGANGGLGIRLLADTEDITLETLAQSTLDAKNNITIRTNVNNARLSGGNLTLQTVQGTSQTSGSDILIQSAAIGEINIVPKGVAGTTGQIITKTATGVEWANAPSGGATKATLSFNSGSAELVGDILTFTHGLGEQHPIIMIYDDSGNVIQPTNIAATSTTVSTIDLTGFTVPATPNWTVTAIG